jgi:hypothetical protein
MADGAGWDCESPDCNAKAPPGQPADHISLTRTLAGGGAASPVVAVV